MAELLENGNIVALVDNWTDTFVATGSQEFSPDDPNYEGFIFWLDEADQPRARALFEAARSARAAV